MTLCCYAALLRYVALPEVVHALRWKIRFSMHWQIYGFPYPVGKNIRIYHDFVQGQGNPPECQRFAVHDEACRVVDVANLWHEGGFPCPCIKLLLSIFLLPLSIAVTNPRLSLSKTASKRFLVRKRRQLALIMASRHCMIYDVTRCSLKRSCLYWGM